MFIESQAFTTVVFPGGVAVVCPSNLTEPLTWSGTDGDTLIPRWPEALKIAPLAGPTMSPPLTRTLVPDGMTVLTTNEFMLPEVEPIELAVTPLAVRPLAEMFVLLTELAVIPLAVIPLVVTLTDAVIPDAVIPLAEIVVALTVDAVIPVATTFVELTVVELTVVILAVVLDTLVALTVVATTGPLNSEEPLTWKRCVVPERPTATFPLPSTVTLADGL